MLQLKASKLAVLATVCLTISATLSGCETTGQAKVYGPNCFMKGYNICALREVVMNPYADPETKRMAEVLLMDNAATTPEQHALARSFAQQPQTVVVPVQPPPLPICVTDGNGQQFCS
jgi:hypothetical protein